MRPAEEIQSELIKLHKEFHRHIKLLNNLKNGEYKNDQASMEQVNSNIKYYHDRIMMLKWVLGNSDHY